MMSEDGSRLRLNSLLLERSFLLSLLSQRALSSRPALTLGCGEIAARFACYVCIIGCVIGSIIEVFDKLTSA